MVQRKTKENLKVLFLYQGGTDGTKERTCLGSRGRGGEGGGGDREFAS